MKMRAHLFFLAFMLTPCFASGQDFDGRMQQAAGLYKEGQYNQSALIFEQWLPEAKKTYGAGDTAWLARYEIAGLCYLKAGRYDKAEQIFTELKKKHSTGRNANPLGYAIDLNHLGKCYEKAGKYQESQSMLEEARNLLQSLPDLPRPALAANLNDLGVLYCDMGNYDSAFSLLNAAVQIRKNEVGVNHPDYAESLDELATCFYCTGKYSTARSMFEEAKSIRKETLGVHHPEYARSLNNMAVYYHTLGLYDSAVPLYQEALSVDREALGNRHPDYAGVLNNLATLYKKIGNYQAALPLLNEAVTIIRETSGEQTPEYARAICTMAGVYTAQGNYQSAVSLYLEAKDIRKLVLGTQHAEYATTLNNLAVLYKRMGNYEAALPLYTEAEAICRNSLGTHHAQYALTLNNLGSLLRILGQYESALPLFEQAMTIFRQTLGTRHVDYTTVLGNQALLLSDMGNYEAALHLLEEVAITDREVVGKDNPDYAADLINLGNHYSQLRNDTSAIGMIQEAVGIYAKASGKRTPEYALALNSLARAYQNFRKFDAAGPLLEEATHIYKEALGSRHPDYAISLKNWAKNYIYQEDYYAAIPLLEEANAIFHQVRMTNSGYYTAILDYLADCYSAVGNGKAAGPLFEEANEVICRNIREYLFYLTEDEKRKFIDRTDYHFDDYLTYLLNERKDAPQLAVTGYNNELLLKGIALSSFTAMQESILQSNDTALIREYEQMRILKRQINADYQKRNDQRRADLTEIETRAGELERSLMRKSKAFNDMRESFSLTSEKVKQVLGENEAAVEFVGFRYGNYSRGYDSILYAAFVVRKNDTIPRMVFLCDEAKLKQAIPSYGAGYKDINLSYGNDAFYSLIWKPLDSLLAGIRTVYYAPSRLLNGISMAAIHCSTEHTLMEKYKLVQLSSTRVLAFQKKQEPLMSAAIYGGINYDADTLALLATSSSYRKPEAELFACNRSLAPGSRKGFNFLPGTLSEATAVKSRLEKTGINTTLYSGNDAVEESFISLSGKNSPSIIHLATHGYYFPDTFLVKGQKQPNYHGEYQFRYSNDPLFRSGLILTGANQAWTGLSLPCNVEDGILTAREVSNLNLTHTQLAVLSACQTGQGDIAGTEGVEGLQRGFKMAGVRYLILSLWEVPDKETKEFMELFYDTWLGGSEIRDAFRSTQLTMSSRYPNEPFRWAAFVLVE